MLTEEQQQQLIELSREVMRQLEEKTAQLNKAAQTISEQTDLIKELSESNLKLVAKLDALTGKTAPGKDYSA